MKQQSIDFKTDATMPTPQLVERVFDEYKAANQKLVKKYDLNNINRKK